MSKRMFQILDEMNVADCENKTAHVAISNAFVSAQLAKGGGHITMGVESSYIHKLLHDENCRVLLLVVDKNEYEKVSADESPKTEQGIEAVEFARWITENDGEVLDKDHWRFRNNTTHSTEHLYKIYKTV